MAKVYVLFMFYFGILICSNNPKVGHEYVYTQIVRNKIYKTQVLSKTNFLLCQAKSYQYDVLRT